MRGDARIVSIDSDAPGLEAEALRERAERYGVSSRFVDVHDAEHVAKVETIRTILGAMGVDVRSDAAAIEDLDERFDRLWTRPLEPVTFARAGTAVTVSPAFPTSLGAVLCAWKVTSEDGSSAGGAFTLGTHEVKARATVRGSDYERFDLRLGALPLGYHRLELSVDGATSASTIVVVPPSCFLPDAIANGGRVWGLAVQVYGLHSKHDAGIGDFADVAEVVAAVKAAGGALVGLSPLHEVAVEPGKTPSPYSPQSRLSIAAFYLDVRALPGYEDGDLDEAERATAKASEYVDYGAAAALVERAIDASFERFRAQPDGPATRRFRRFVRDGGEMLQRMAIFAALAKRFGKDGAVVAWQDWPEDYRDAGSLAVAAFARESSGAVERELFVQWQADVQLANVADAAGGMPVGLYRDVAVGASSGGAETWAFGRAMPAGVTVGAPPDVLNRSGQNWGVAAFDPAALRDVAYGPFAALLRANMRHAGAIRIDHVMALARLWWVPEGASAADGVYVNYRLDEMLAIVALESVRAKCLVIGEDLGTVPAGFRERLAEYRILSYRLFTFEVDADGRHVLPEKYPNLALVSSSTHDLAPIAAHVGAYDVGVREAIGLLDAEAAAGARAERQLANAQVWEALEHAGLPPAALKRLTSRTEFEKRDRERVTEAVTAFLARTPSAILMLPLEDVLGDLNQPNIPTTLDEHPNWRRRALASVEAIVMHPRLKAFGALLAERRSNP